MEVEDEDNGSGTLHISCHIDQGSNGSGLLDMTEDWLLATVICLTLSDVSETDETMSLGRLQH